MCRYKGEDFKMKKLLSILLALIMVCSILPPITVRAYINNVYQLEFNDLQYEHIELNTFSTIQPEPQEAINVPLREQPRQTEPSTVIYSQAHQNYNLLRTGNYNSTQVIDRFHQLFGHLSPDYILHNYPAAQSPKTAYDQIIPCFENSI